MLMVVMVLFKGEYGEIIYILPSVNVTSSVINIRMLLDRLVALRKEEGGVNLPALFYMQCYMLYTDAIYSVFHKILEEIQIQRDRHLADYIPRCLNVQ